MNTLNDSVAVFSCIIAFFAVIIGPFVTIHVSNRQIRANIIPTFRQEWINLLRDEITNFVDFIVAAGASIDRDSANFANNIKGLTRLQTTITLLLNPNEIDHKELCDLLQGAIAVAGSEDSPSENSAMKLAEMRAQINKCTMSILKREWERVKDLN